MENANALIRLLPNGIAIGDESAPIQQGHTDVVDDRQSVFLRHGSCFRRNFHRLEKIQTQRRDRLPAG